MATFNETLTETVALDESGPVAGWTVSLDDLFGTVVLIDVVRLFTMAPLADALELAEALATDRGATITERLGLGSDLLVNWLAQQNLSDAVAVLDGLYAAIPVGIEDTVAIEPSLAGVQALVLIDTLGVAPVLIGNAAYGLSASDAIGLSDSLANFFGVELSDAFEIAETLAGARTTYNALQDGVGVADAIAPQLLIRADLTDSLDITLEQVVSAIYFGTVEDGIELTAAYVAPDGVFTTWTMNTRTAAVTEYSNYEFNSFGRLGNRYVGASSSGLYWLDGDTDVGEDIVGRLRSGFMQFGGTHLSRLKAAYLATRGEADFVLMIETGEGAIYRYGVSTRSMRSTKVHMGKGQRSRYFSFELIGVGDFDIETLEFVPLVVQRRV